MGELSLSGQLRPCAGMLPMALAAKREGLQALYVPEENAAEATLADGPAVSVPGAFTTAAITLGVLITLLLGIVPSLALGWAGAGGFVS